jgi:N-methylhydantoinase A
MNYKIGVDVGGTFTDLVLWSDAGGLRTFKTLSTPADPSVGVLRGIGLMADALGLSVGELASQTSSIVHGTTVTTNATLTRNGARTGLLTTAGVRDALEMRRGIREEQYNNRYQNVEPLVPRHLRRPVAGRLDYKGDEKTPLSMEDVQSALALFRARGVEAVAICFMNSFANPDHERAVAEVVKSEMPDTYLCVSSAVSPTIRFYNRVSTTVMSAYVGPILRDYLSSLTTRLGDAGFRDVLLIMQSNGGVALPDVVSANPATTLLSGPAGGPCAAAAYSRTRGHDDCIVVDMGGTSFDTSVVRAGAAAMTHDGEVDRLRMSLPMLAITTIGAGGGSIGRVDIGGLLRMGPQSAGAMPGPACYGRGGQQPTCTDANLVLGYLDPGFFAGGEMQLDVDAARTAIRTAVAEPMDVHIEEAAAGMYRVINTNMAHGVREITVQRGVDPREFPMVVAGGASALHACMIARELEMPGLLVPRTASVLCACGMLMTDLQHDYVRSMVCRLRDLDLEKVQDLIAEMIDEGSTELRREGITGDRVGFRVQFDLRYLKQYHEVTVDAAAESIASGDLEAIATVFHSEHDRLYGYDLSEKGTDLELINLRVRGIGQVEKPELPRIGVGDADPTAARKGVRRAFSPERNEFVEMPVFDGDALSANNVIRGPALVERSDTTILVTESFTARVDEYGSLVLTAAEEQGDGDV